MEKEWVDFKAVKAAVSMQMVLDNYGVKGLKKTGDELRGPCPIHEAKKSARSFTVNLTKNAFHCFSCGSRGNVLDFVAAMEECSVKDAALKLAEWLKVGDREAQDAGKAVTDGFEESWDALAKSAPVASGDVALTICLQSDVLVRAGFGSGDRFSIECAPGRITLVKVDDSG